MRALRFSIVALWLSCMLCASAQSDPAPTETQAIAAIKAELEKRSTADQFSGAALIAKNGKPIFQAAYGVADRDQKIPNAIDTKFRFGSMGKMFTAVAVLQLAQAGKLKLDDPLGKFLPDYPNKEVAKVTLHQLLTHTGGTGNIFGPEFDLHRTELKELKDYVALYGERGPEFEPGSRHEYSNYGFILLGRVIEAVSGKSYDAYVRDHIFKPAGMNDTDNLPEEWRVRNLSIPYTSSGSGLELRLIGPAGAPPPTEAAGPPRGQLRLRTPDDDEPLAAIAPMPLHSAADTLPYSGTSAGGGYSTVTDCLKFVKALRANMLLDAQHTQLLLSGKVDTARPDLKYAYGFEDLSLPNGMHRYGHGGGAAGMNGVLSFFDSSPYLVVVLANLDPPAATEIEQFIRTRLPL